MKKIILIIISIFILSGCTTNTLPKEDIDETNSILYPKPSLTCNNEPKEYITIENRKIYLVCLEEVYLNKEDNQDITLKYHLQNTYQTIDDSIKSLVSNITDIEILRDGGTKIYKNEKYTIITCKKEQGNKNIYIGTNKLTFKDEYCA